MDMQELRALESAMGWTPEQFAEILGIDARSLRRWKKDTRLPSTYHQRFLEALRPALGNTGYRLLGGHLLWAGLEGVFHDWVEAMLSAEKPKTTRKPRNKGPKAPRKAQKKGPKAPAQKPKAPKGPKAPARGEAEGPTEEPTKGPETAQLGGGVGDDEEDFV